MRSLRWTGSALLLASTACFGGTDEPQYVLLEPQPGTLGIGAIQQLETSRQPGALPPTVNGHFELSQYAIERFESLEARLTVSSGVPLKGEGSFQATWRGEFSGQPILGYLDGEHTTIWAADLVTGACTQPPCVLSFELAPAGEWNSGLQLDELSLEYELRAWLQVRGQYRSEVQELEGALQISLEEAP